MRDHTDVRVVGPSFGCGEEDKGGALACSLVGPTNQFTPNASPLPGFIHRQVRQISRIGTIRQCPRHTDYSSIAPSGDNDAGSGKHLPQPLSIIDGATFC